MEWGTAREAGRSLVRPRYFRWVWRPHLSKSLSTRVALTLAVALLLILALVGVFINFTLRAQLFDARKTVVLEDASVRFTQAQHVFDQAAVSSPDQLQEVVRQQLITTKDSAAGAGAIAVMLLRSEGASEDFMVNEFVNRDLLDLLDEPLRVAVGEGYNMWQSAALPTAAGGTAPGIIVGSLVELPLAGPYELFIFYSLAAEQQTILLVMKIIGAASIPLILLAMLATFGLIYQMLRPVRSTAIAAMRLADGDLDSRVEVTGEDEMAQLGAAFNEMAASLETQISEYDHLAKLQQRFVSDVSHELRTPLTTIAIADEMIQTSLEGLTPAAQRSAEILHSEVASMEQMLADLLEISRYDAQSEQLAAEPTDICALVTKTVDAMAELAERLGVTVQVLTCPADSTADVDDKRIERAVRNLLVNAYEYSEQEPVTVTVETEADTVTIHVADQGVGMSAETIDRVFDRFFRADPARVRTTGGTGLGLAIAYEDVTAHGGTITAASAPGQGSVFSIVLPRRLGDPVAPVSPADNPVGGED